MEKILQHISRFIAKQTVASVCCSGPNGELHCFSCYYAFNEKKELLYFKTSGESLHMQYLQANPVLAGTILPDKLNKLSVQGIQFNGELLLASPEQDTEAAKLYYLRFPFALAMEGTVQTMKINRIKMTDNTLGFGTKLVWDRLHASLAANQANRMKTISR